MLKVELWQLVRERNALYGLGLSFLSSLSLLFWSVTNRSWNLFVSCRSPQSWEERA